jgi:hypothetical protein
MALSYFAPLIACRSVQAAHDNAARGIACAKAANYAKLTRVKVFFVLVKGNNGSG